MKTILYMAISVDGYVAKKDDDTDWVCDTDWGEFTSLIKDVGCVVMGKRTYEVSGEDFPYENALNVVMTSDSKLIGEKDGVIFTDKQPSEILKIVDEKNHEEVLVMGGGLANGSWLKSGLIDEVFLSVHPIILGEGIKLFENVALDVKLEKVGVKELEEGLVQLHYKVEK